MELWPYLLNIASWVGSGLIKTILNHQQEGPSLEGAVIIVIEGVEMAFCQTDQRKHHAAIAADNF